jgi:hypothetical protein
VVEPAALIDWLPVNVLEPVTAKVPLVGNVIVVAAVVVNVVAKLPVEI